ncbi:MAG TPA: NAD(P)H-dependent glycerol-3-phosphate dehydrogenase [Candidatus Binatia bacterium]|jgi:glycerol-3-phosphate dehydrogenase (NAD(P)+)
MTTNVAVIGAGSWGTALASLLAGKGYSARLWSRGAEVCHGINEHHENRVYLPGVALPPSLRATTDLSEALDGAELVVAVVPSHAMRGTMEKAARVIRPDALVVSASKGIEDDSLLTMHGVIADAIGSEKRVGALSGPSFAVEVAGGQPAVVVAAATTEETAERVQHFFHAPMLRVYRSTDMVGVELGGVVKNVMAIATGVSDGLGYGLNARAATITRGLAEIMRLAISMGGRPETLSGLAGIGDLVLTCTGDLSRNRQVGLRLGRGETIESILGGMRMVAEGVRNTKSVRDLARRQNVEMPIVECAYKVLYEGMSPGQALEELFGRSLKPEFP